MSEFITALEKLQNFYASDIEWEELKQSYDLEIQMRKAKNSSSIKTDHEVNEIQFPKVLKIPFIKFAVENWKPLFIILQDISRLLNNLLESEKDFAVSWSELIVVAPRKQYLAFVYALMGLHSLDVTCGGYAQLSLAAARLFLLSTSISGAKGFHIFEEAIISHALQTFSIAEKIHDPDLARYLSKSNVAEVWLLFTDICDVIKLLFRGTHLDSVEHVREEIMRKLIEMQHNTYTRGFMSSNAANLHGICFEILDEILSKHESGQEKILMKIMNLSLDLHTCAAKTKFNSSECEHISDWFIKCIPKYPAATQYVLKTYIEWTITSPDGRWKNEQGQRSLDYAAKYDAALLKICNVSCVSFLCNAINALEVPTRLRCVDLMSKILLYETNDEFGIFDKDSVSVTRELILINELILSIQDQSNQIKFKAAQAIHQTFDKGSRRAKDIFKKCLQYAKFNDVNVVLPKEPLIRRNEIRYRKPIIEIGECPVHGWETIENTILNFPQYIYDHLYRNNIAYIRRTGIVLIQIIAKLNHLLIFNTHFVEETMRLVDEPSASVRKQILAMLDFALSCYPNCHPIIWVWCAFISLMLNDEDPKNTELAIECFVSKVLANVRPQSLSNQAQHYMPWLIVRTLMETNKDQRMYLQNCFHKHLKPQMVDRKIFDAIESHATSWYALEAWILLNFMAGKVKSKEPDTLIQKYIKVESLWITDIVTIAIEVLIANIKHFSEPALIFIFNHFLSKFRNGTIHLAFISKAFDFIVGIDEYQQSNNLPSETNKNWLIDLYNHVESTIISMTSSTVAQIPKSLWSYLHIYSVINVTLPRRPNVDIIKFIHKCMNDCLLKPSESCNLEIESILNATIAVSGRLALRSAFDVGRACKIYGRILNIIDWPSVVQTTIVVLSDLGKKYMHIVEKIMEPILKKLSSPFAENRISTLESVTELVLQDQLKLRGSVLLALLSIILDPDKRISYKAVNFFAECVSTKNPTLFQKCLIECPFVLNEYANIDGLDSFVENTIRSSLKGSKNRRKRKELYNHLMKNIEIIPLLLYFDNLKSIAEKSAHDPLIKSAEGTAMITDFFFIVRRICQITAAHAEQKSSDKNDSNEACAEIAETSNNDSTATTKSSGTASKTHSRGRRREVTMADALNSVEKSLAFLPIISKNIDNKNALIVKSVDDLAKAICRRFPSFVEFAQPQEFWIKHLVEKNSATQKKNDTRRKENTTNGACDDSIMCDVYSEDDMDDTDDVSN